LQGTVRDILHIGGKNIFAFKITDFPLYINETTQTGGFFIL